LNVLYKSPHTVTISAKEILVLQNYKKKTQLKLKNDAPNVKECKMVLIALWKIRRLMFNTITRR